MRNLLLLNSVASHNFDLAGLEPKDADLMLALLGNRAACYMNINQFQKALADCNRALEIDPKYVKGFLRAGKCHLRIGDFADAKQAFEQVPALPARSSH